MHLVGSNVAEGTPFIYRIQPIVLQYSGPLDPATVNVANIRVNNMDAYKRKSRHYASLNYDPATWQITITAPNSWTSGQIFEAVITGITDEVGNPVADATITWGVKADASLKAYYYTATGINFYYDFTPDTATGLTSKYTYFYGIGGDATWETADDTSTYRIEYVINPAFRIDSYTYYDHGPDLLPNTADDFAASFTQYHYDENGLGLGYTYTSAGADKILFNGDDTAYHVAFLKDDEGIFLGTVKHSSPGADNTSVSNDDFVIYTLDGNKFTANYTIGRVGADLVPGTADDVIRYDNTYTRDENGFLVETEYYHRGTDEIPGTGDDYRYRYINTLDENNRTIRTVTVFAGLDVLLDTPDDSISSYSDIFHNQHGQTVMSRSFSSPGLNGQWFTPDDNIGSERYYSFSASGQMIRSYVIHGGGDGDISTPGDNYISYEALYQVLD